MQETGSQLDSMPREQCSWSTHILPHTVLCKLGCQLQHLMAALQSSILLLSSPAASIVNRLPHMVQSCERIRLHDTQDTPDPQKWGQSLRHEWRLQLTILRLQKTLVPIHLFYWHCELH